MNNSEKLKDLLQFYSIPFKENSKSFILNCPRCSKNKLYFHKNKWIFICFKCSDGGFKGRIEWALSEITGLHTDEFKDKLYNSSEIQAAFNLNVNFKDLWETDFGVEKVYTLPELSWSPDFISLENPLFKKAASYLYQKRGLSEKHIKKYNLKYHPSWQTIVFPVEFEGSLYGWQERSIVNDFKYTVKGFDKSKILMFQDQLLNSKHAVLTEGPVDCLKADLCGGNVCSMGKIVSNTQLDIIKKYVKKLYVALDPDAWKEIDEICRSVNGELEVYLMPPVKGKKDHGECTEQEVYEQFKNAQKWYGQTLTFFFYG